jgi:hypothetical protein
MTGKRLWVRGAITLGILVAFAAAMVVAPAGAHITSKFGHLKKHIKKIAKTEANTAANNAVAADNAAAEGVFASFKNGPVEVPNTLTTISSLTVPAGKYAVLAKVTVEDTDPGFDTTSFCQLNAGGTLDNGEAYAETSNEAPNDSGLVIALEVVREFTGSGGTINLLCADNDTVDQAKDIKIIAIRGPSLSNVAAAKVAPKAPVGREG